MKNKKIFFIVFTFLLFLFCYFRIKPIYFQTVPYTYDQGRDFLKAEEIIRYKNPTFIGPTTGIIGVYHGAWWYYVLVIPYIIFQGNPTGFIVFLFLLALFQYILFTLFLKKYFNWLAALFFAASITASSYFISTSVFAISSVLNLCFVLSFFFFLYKFLEKKDSVNLFFLFLSLGFILESGEMVLGLFIIPSFVISVILFGQFKNFFSKIKNLAYSLLGLFIPMLPRILFEIKNGFPELKVILSFITQPHIYNPRTFTQRLYERILLFYNFYNTLFPEKNIWFGIIIAPFIIVGLVIGYKNFPLIKKNFLKLVLSTLTFLFILSLFYPDNFWPNYYEGLPYFFCLLLALGVFGFQKKKFKKTFLNYLPFVYLSIMIIFITASFIKDLKIKPEISGMKTQITAIKYIYDRVGSNEFCAKIYTPPVIPYTYNYLFSYYSQKNNFKLPSDGFINNQCYFVMEKEQEGELFQQRIVKWRKENIPENASFVNKKVINDDVAIELWRMK